MLDTRSGRLLTSQSFQQTFTQLRNVPGGIAYFLHHYEKGEEIVELYHHDLTLNARRLVTRFIHHPRPETRPTQWHASLSPDGSLLAYQQHALQPVITIASGTTGEKLSTIRWQGDLTAMSVFFHPQNKLIAIPLARWNAACHYDTEYKLLLADPATGQVLRVFNLPHVINQVHFRDNGMTLITENPLSIGRASYDASDMVWTRPADKHPATTHVQVFRQNNLAGYVARPGGTEPAEFHHLALTTGTSHLQFKLESEYIPIGLRGDMLVSEKYIPRNLPNWLQKLNERVHLLARRYVIAPQVNTVRFQDVATGEIRQEMQFPHRSIDEHLTRRIPGTTKFAAIFKQDDHLGIEFYDIFPFWTHGRLLLFSLGITLLLHSLFMMLKRVCLFSIKPIEPGTLPVQGGCAR